MNRRLPHSIITSTRMRDDLLSLLDRIRGLLDRRGDDPALLAELEHTLTDGYAQRLRLEGEHRRLGRDIGELARSVDGDDEAGELRRLAARVAAVDAQLAQLRPLLAALRARTDAVRAA
jgi:hypothetical protein